MKHHHVIPRAVITLGVMRLVRFLLNKGQGRLAVKSLIEVNKQGSEIIISHGNGPQVGLINHAFEEASKVNDRFMLFDLPECTAMTRIENPSMRLLKKLHWPLKVKVVQLFING